MHLSSIERNGVAREDAVSFYSYNTIDLESTCIDPFVSLAARAEAFTTDVLVQTDGVVLHDAKIALYLAGSTTPC